MYESPIELLFTDIQHQIVEQQEEQIYQAVIHFVPNVNRDELLRALKYDRGQYDKGYADGVAEATPKWIPVTESLPGICEPVLVCCDFMGGKAFRVSDRYGKNGMLWTGVPQSQKVTHWMPLPEPPKEGNTA